MTHSYCRVAGSFSGTFLWLYVFTVSSDVITGSQQSSQRREVSRLSTYPHGPGSFLIELSGNQLIKCSPLRAGIGKFMIFLGGGTSFRAAVGWQAAAGLTRN